MVDPEFDPPTHEPAPPTHVWPWAYTETLPRSEYVLDVASKRVCAYIAHEPLRVMALEEAIVPATLNCPPVQETVVAEMVGTDPVSCCATARRVTFVFEAPM